MGSRDRDLAELVERQAGVASRQQLLALGLSSSAIAHRVSSGRWVTLHPGVYATLPGRDDFLVRVWAALLHSGPSAVASHRSAGVLQGLVDQPPSVVDVAVRERHRVHPRPGIRVHRRRFLTTERRAVATVPQTRTEVTVLDLVGECLRAEDVVGWLARACQRRLITPPRILEAMAFRSRQRWRALVAEVLADVADGVASPLELFYRKLERRHGLPRGEANARTTVRGTNRYTDMLYRRFRLRVELESLVWHPEDARWRDARRDNEAVMAGDAVLRYDWRAVVGRPCDTAAEVASVLRARGWAGHAAPCSPTCGLRRVA
jgi:hypothetical protein